MMDFGREVVEEAGMVASDPPQVLDGTHASSSVRACLIVSQMFGHVSCKAELVAGVMNLDLITRIGSGLLRPGFEWGLAKCEEMVPAQGIRLTARVISSRPRRWLRNFFLGVEAEPGNIIITIVFRGFRELPDPSYSSFPSGGERDG